MVCNLGAAGRHVRASGLLRVPQMDSVAVGVRHALACEKVAMVLMVHLAVVVGERIRIVHPHGVELVVPSMTFNQILRLNSLLETISLSNVELRSQHL